MKNLQAVHDAIVKAVPDTLIPCSHCGGNGYDVQIDHAPGCEGDCRQCPVQTQVRCSQCTDGIVGCRPITLEDVLRAMHAARSSKTPDAVRIDGTWLSGTMVYDLEHPGRTMWHLGKPLTDQPEATIDFLFGILCKL